MRSYHDCIALDRADPLAGLRRRFRLPEGLVYLDGNSLGPLPSAVPERVGRVVEEEWGTDLIRSWNRHGWVDLPLGVGAKIGALIGAEPASVVVGDSTSVNLYKAVSAGLGLAAGRPTILTDTGNFPSDLYVMSGIARVMMVEPEEVVAAIDEHVGVVALSQVDYRTGRRHHLGEVTAAAHSAGAVVVWDLAHSTGAFPVEVAAAEVDLAVGCGYKYLNGGPGAPGFLYVAPRHQGAFANPIRGWFGHANPFDFPLGFTPGPGIVRGRVGTPPVLSLAALDAALEVFDGIDLELVRAKSVSLSELFIDLVRSQLPELRLASPSSPESRGSHVSYHHPDGLAVMAALIDRGVIGDFRPPDLMRFGFAPLYLRHADVWEGVVSLTDVVSSGVWKDPRYAVRSPVT